MFTEPYPLPIPLEYRRAILQRVIGAELQGAGRVVHEADTWAVLAYGSEPAHAVHALISVLTCGAWLVVWLLVVATGGERRRTVSVDEWGQVHVAGWRADLMQPPRA